MSMTPEDLEVLREGWDFEAKKAAGRDGRGEVPLSFWETYSAMANSYGGRIVLGVKERRDHSFVVHGIADPEKVERDLWTTLDNPSKVSVNLMGRDHVEQEVLDGRTIIVVRVPRASRQQRPVYINGDIWSGTFVRMHEGDHRVGREQVRRMIADAEYDTRDDRLLHGFGMDDLDADSIRGYRNVFQSRQHDHPWLALGDVELLAKLGAWRRDRDSGEEGPTLAGMLMFGTFESIQEVLPRYFVDFQERESDTGAIEWSDRVHPDGTWSGNLYDFYRRVIVKLTADLRVPFRLQGGLQRVDQTHVHEAVREAFINSLIHADYEGRMSILAVKRPDGFLFRNPGTPRIPIEQIREGGISDCRNRTLLKMFSLLGFGEQAGSGFSRILRAWKEQNWRSPALRESIELEMTELTLSTHSLLPPPIMDELEAQFGQDFTDLDPNDQIVLAAARAEGRVDHPRLRELVDLHSRDLTVLLQRFLRNGMLERIGRGKGCTYRVPAAERPMDGGGDSEQKGSRSVQNGDGSVHSGPRSEQNGGRSEHESTEDPGEIGPRQDPPWWDEPEVRQVRGTRRTSPQTVTAAILAACRGGYATLPELGRGLNRSPETLRVHYVSSLVREGRLEMLYPGAPNDPRQAYRTPDRARGGGGP